MLTLPKIITRDALAYVGIREKVSMQGIPQMVDKNFPALFKWFDKKGLEPAGAAFIRYHVIDMTGLLDIEVGMAVAEAVEGDGAVKAGTLPGGEYATLTFWGPYDQLLDANAVLIGWAKEKGIKWDTAEKPDGDHFACRLEIYNTDPAVEADSSKWETEVLIKTA